MIAVGIYHITIVRQIHVGLHDIVSLAMALSNKIYWSCRKSHFAIRFKLCIGASTHYVAFSLAESQWRNFRRRR